MAGLAQLVRKAGIHKRTAMQHGREGAQQLAIADGMAATQPLNPLLGQRLEPEGIRAGIEHGHHQQRAASERPAQLHDQLQHRAIG